MREIPRETYREMSCPLRTETASCSPQILPPRAAYQGYPVIHNCAHTSILSTFQTYNKKKVIRIPEPKINTWSVKVGGRAGSLTLGNSSHTAARDCAVCNLHNRRIRGVTRGHLCGVGRGVQRGLWHHGHSLFPAILAVLSSPS